MTGNNKSLFKQILTWTVVGVIALVALRIAFRLLGIAFGLAAFLAFTVGPVLLVGWLAVKAWDAFVKRPAAEG